MTKPSVHISVFEHEILQLGQIINGITFQADTLQALENYYGKEGVPYYSLIKNGVRFNEHVGVIQIGNTLIEVLPKADKADRSVTKWRNLLIGMLRTSGIIDIYSTSSSNLRIKSNTILDLYFELFVTEIESMLHLGLIKKYNHKQGNVSALKGRLLFAKQIQHNLIHQERFFVKHTAYNVQHLLNQILYKTICLLKQINTNSVLQSRIGALLLSFPEMADIKVTESTFAKLEFSRKNQFYKKAIEISKHLLLQYHPDVSRGRNHVLALMFDMNNLWEQFVYVSLRKHKINGTTITAQHTVNFWKPEKGSSSNIRPDILIKNLEGTNIVIDTKWKNLNGLHPSSEDLRQMYAYHEFLGASKVALIYPGSVSHKSSGHFHRTPSYDKMDKECSVIFIHVPYDEYSEQILTIRTWQNCIHEYLINWIQSK
ncbi:McrC family protein [Pseudobacter ginsenosidimutans]|uniref:5-methylcytosine-specific restriction enzyme subunit McrC n=1 Tax=Pseudobacter ginsenosidimutans TaxID=661488 RepID=A0A4Q7N4P9_9BACT|nr:restriction endonuclease [Pseudobacter ginsenosidimutans]QEC44520.1 restriction endonuclease [Pseudobacter ginsenosidimutans]RZS75994.1 5-methylcytosine-specific restriction enzyme subunit McrC [Pseudobacter ginsenosidimutans]